jgi:hypothetical protein
MVQLWRATLHDDCPCVCPPALFFIWRTANVDHTVDGPTRSPGVARDNVEDADKPKRVRSSWTLDGVRPYIAMHKSIQLPPRFDPNKLLNLLQPEADEIFETMDPAHHVAEVFRVHPRQVQ